MSDRSARLYWKGQFVVALADTQLVDWPWCGGYFEPGTFPKELADALNWWQEHQDDEDTGDDPGIPEGLFGDWALHFPDGTVEAVFLGWPDFEKGFIQWR